MQFECEIESVRSRASDGTIHVTLELPEYALSQAQELLGMIHGYVSCQIKLIASPDQGTNNDFQARAKRKSKRET
jgi:hypothetical protein